MSPRDFDSGNVDSESQVSPDEEDALPVEGTEAPDPEAAMLDALTSAMQSRPTLEFDVEDQDEPDPEADADEYEEDEPDDQPTEGRAPRTEDEWAEIIQRDGPQRFAEVPRKLQAVVAEKYGDLRARQAATDAQTVVADYYSRLRRATDAVARVDDNFADDPDGKLAWLESEDPNAATYVQLRNWIRQANTQPPQEQVQQVAVLQSRAQAQFNRLADFPDQQAELANRAGQQRYTQSEEGVSLLQADVDQLLAAGIEAKVARKGEPARRRAQERVAGAERRRNTPVPDTSPGRATRPETDISQTNNPNELFAIGVSRKFANLRK